MKALRGCASVLLASAAVSGCALSADAEGAAIDQIASLTLEEDLRIGSRDDPDQGFSSLGGVRVAHSGDVFVLELQDLEVRAFAPDGRLLRKIGREGEGPGEFRSVNLFGLQGDTVWVLDQESRRMTLFTTAGELLSTVPATGVGIEIPVPNVRVNAYPAMLRADGRFDAMFDVVNMPGGRIDRPVTLPLLVFDATGAPVDTAGFETIQPNPVVQVAGRFVSVASPLDEDPLGLSVESDSVHVQRTAAETSDETTFTVVRSTESGDTVFRRDFRYAPVPVTSAARDSLVRERIRPWLRILQATDTIQLRTAVESSMELPAYLPPVTAAQAGADGSLWVRLTDDGTDVWRWLVLRSDGSARGIVALPKTTSVEWMDEDQVWVVEHDGLDVPWVVRYRIGA